jgi:zinc protease
MKIPMTIVALSLLSRTLPAQVKAPPPPPPAIPARPEALTFKPILYDPPRAEAYRVSLQNGMVVFIAEDKTLPLVNMVLHLRAGSYLEPPGKEGLAELTGSQLRRGGTKSLSAEQLDERLDVLATQVGTRISDTSGLASLNCLKDNLDTSLKTFVEILKEPRFQEDRIALAKDATLQEMAKRNDDAAQIERREWHVLLLGEKHFVNRFPTEASIKGLTRDDLVAFHKTFVHPSAMVAAVSGSFEKAEMLAKLEAAFSGWPTPPPAVPLPPATIDPVAPGLYRIEKDVNQGRVSIGLPTVMRDSPDIYALEVMNELLGGSFTSRITQAVRSNEGLAYQAGSVIDFGIYYPGSFRALFQSKSETVAYATELVLAEIKRMRVERVTASELDTIQKNLIETFPSHFATPGQAMGLFASDEFTKRSPEYLRTYRERIRAVTAADVQRVAQKYLEPEKMIILVVGAQKAIDAGDGKHRANLAELAGGRVTALPLRDPMTMRRPE